MFTRNASSDHRTRGRRGLRRARTGGIAALLALVGAAALVACSSSSSAGTATAAAAAATTAATATATSTPAAAATTAPASAATLAIGVGETTALGPFLTAPDGRTLYVFLKDEPGKSNCTGGCLQAWPPLTLGGGQQVAGDAAATGTLDSIDTPSGTQVTYNGAPLYEFAKDAAPGDVNGENVGGIWFVARPDTASTAFVGVRADGAKAPYLVAPNGLSLYTFAKDTAGVSNCTGSCLTNWPALVLPKGMAPTAVSAASGKLDMLARDDGTQQITYQGLPLYTFAGDHLPADVSGDGVGGVWSLAKP